MLAGWLAGWPEIYQSRRFECVESDRSFHPLNLQVLANSVNASVNVHDDDNRDADNDNGDVRIVGSLINFNYQLAAPSLATINFRIF